MIMPLLLLLFFYCIPLGVAANRKHQNFGAICALNLLLGWTFLGWVAALVWALTTARQQSVVIIDGRPYTAITERKE
jgi:hypothetical protein